jgi:hypothetical protein
MTSCLVKVATAPPSTLRFTSSWLPDKKHHFYFNKSVYVKLPVDNGFTMVLLLDTLAASMMRDEALASPSSGFVFRLFDKQVPSPSPSPSPPLSGDASNRDTAKPVHPSDSEPKVSYSKQHLVLPDLLK